MDSREMIFQSPQFQIKDLNDEDWQKVSEKDFLTELVDNFDLITPILKDLFQGRNFIDRGCIYRIQNFW